MATGNNQVVIENPVINSPFAEPQRHFRFSDEGICMEIGDVSGGGIIVAERRGPTLDHQLELAWLNLKVQGTRFMQAKAIERRVLGLNLRDKSENIAALQLADLVVTPIGRYVLGKTIKEDFEIVKSKFRRNRDGEYEGYGLVTLPQK
jgi:hypothetical protein